MRLDQTEAVKRQYADDRNLALRIEFHAKYSTNKQGLVPWLFEQYKFRENDGILELGCGNAAQWEGRTLPRGCKLLLSDFSPGMLLKARERLSSNSAAFQVIDIQDIPFEDASFDVIIANFMLYHVPDLAKALAEVRRVLKPGGTFYAATCGLNGHQAYVNDALRQINPDSGGFAQVFSFTLQNGGERLRKYFTSVERVDYIDSLAVTNARDLVDWICSAISGKNYHNNPELLCANFEKIRARDGAIHIPKETGLFICKI